MNPQHTRVTPSLSVITGVWAARADYLPTPLEPREVHGLLLPTQPEEFPLDDVSGDQQLALQRLSLQEREGNGREQGALKEKETDTSVQDKTNLEREVREALFRGGVGSPAVKKRPIKSHEYKGQPLLGAWATAGQTGALVVQKPGEPVKSSPVKFSIQSQGSSAASSGSTTPSQAGSRTPNYRADQTPPRQSRTPNWSTPQNERYHRGNRRRFQHSKSGPERTHQESSPSPQHRTTRRYNSEQYPGSDQSHRQKQSHDRSDRSDQSHANNWNIHMSRSPTGDRRGKTRGRGRGRGRGRPISSHASTVDDREGSFVPPSQESRDTGSQYQRSQSDVPDRPVMRGASSNPPKKPYSEPTIRGIRRDKK